MENYTEHHEQAEAALGDTCGPTTLTALSPRLSSPGCRMTLPKCNDTTLSSSALTSGQRPEATLGQAPASPLARSL